jgi:hypothetical protein
MKRFISLVCGSLVLILMFLSPGNSVQAEEACDCPGTVLTGAERNKLVANLLKSDVFKQAKHDLKNEGYAWQGAGAIEVSDFRNLTSSELLFMLGIPEEHPMYAELIHMDMAGILETLGMNAFPSLGYQVVFVDEAGTLYGAAFFLTNGQLGFEGKAPLVGHEH